ncbi:rRNA biogenesis protein RRP5-like isoform X2 [Papaver somniferum]|nr:rRNA biogenesis protein RRP5-like isoform X2 [Papaver somniferum]
MNRAWPGIGEEALKGSIENKIHGQDGDGTKIVDGKLYPENMVITSKFSLYFRDNVGIFDVADEKVRKLETKYKEVGFCSCLHSRIWALGRTHIECLGGMVVKGKVTSVGDFGADVQLSTGVKEFCPLTHMSEPEVPKPGKKFKV